VVEGLVRELALARFVAGLGQRELLALDHVQRLPAAGALQRQARVDGERLALGGASAARLSATRGYTDDERRNAHRRHQPTNSQGVPLRLGSETGGIVLVTRVTSAPGNRRCSPRCQRPNRPAGAASAATSGRWDWTHTTAARTTAPPAI